MFPEEINAPTFEGRIIDLKRTLTASPNKFQYN